MFSHTTTKYNWIGHLKRILLPLKWCLSVDVSCTLVIQQRELRCLRWLPDSPCPRKLEVPSLQGRSLLALHPALLNLLLHTNRTLLDIYRWGFEENPLFPLFPVFLFFILFILFFYFQHIQIQTLFPVFHVISCTQKFHF